MNYNSVLAEFIQDISAPNSAYKDRDFMGSYEEYLEILSKSSTLYIGNLSFYTTEEQIYEFFRTVAPIKRIIMGLDRVMKTPCGFCFIEFHTHEDASQAKLCLNGLKLDERIVRIDFDHGFAEGRQYGRGKHGGQVRDEYREDFDPGRGGWGFQTDKQSINQ